MAVRTQPPQIFFPAIAVVSIFMIKMQRQWLVHVGSRIAANSTFVRHPSLLNDALAQPRVYPYAIFAKNVTIRNSGAFVAFRF